MTKQAWSVTGAMTAQSAAHDQLEAAINEGRAFELWIADCHVGTVATYDAAKAFVGKSKRYTIVPQA